jgi:hypothetical protein
LYIAHALLGEQKNCHAHCVARGQGGPRYVLQHEVAPDRRADLEAKILAFIDEWNEITHPFDWTPTSFEKVLNSVTCGAHGGGSAAARPSRRSHPPAQRRRPARPLASTPRPTQFTGGRSSVWSSR